MGKYDSYLPKKPEQFRKALADFLEPSKTVEQQDALARSSGRDRVSRWGGTANNGASGYKRDRLHMKEIRLDKTMFLFEGDWPRGAHFPLCAATRNNSDRSDEAKARRQGNKGRNRLARAESETRASVVTDVRAVRSHRPPSSTRSSVGAASSRGQPLEPQAASSSRGSWDTSGQDWKGYEPQAAPSSRGSWETSGQYAAASSSSQSGPQSRYRQPTSGRGSHMRREIRQTNPPPGTEVSPNSRSTHVPPVRDPYWDWPHWAQQ